MRINRVLGVLGICLILLVPVRVSAQVDQENFQQFEFNFVPPGARATAMGGTFISLADDATAAVTNPAGLLSLLRPEVSFEFRFYDHIVDRLIAGEALLTDPTFEITTKTTGDELTSPAYASIVFPFHNFAIGLFRHEFLRFRDEYGFRSRPVPGIPDVFFPMFGRIDMKGVQYGLALALRTGPIDWGVTFKFMRMTVKSGIRRGFFFRGENFGLEEFMDESDNAFGVTFGFIAHLSPKVQFGAAASIHPRFTFDKEALFFLVEDQREILNVIQPTIGVPHQIGGGLVIRPTDTFTLTADVVWVGLSRIFDRSKLIYQGFSDVFAPNITPDRFFMRDRVEFHSGMENIVFLGNVPLALRVGVFVIPQRLLRFRPVSQPSNEYEAFVSAINEFLYNTLDENTNVGLSGGLGLAFGGHLQIDIAYSISESLKIFTSSAVLRF